jgi:phosphoribosylformylglycinamidine synthase subunit PurS
VYKASVKVTLKKGILDPQGKAVEGALKNLRYENISEVRIGKYIEFLIEENDEVKARRQAAEMSKKLLANVVIEDYHVEIGDIK